MWQLHCKMMSDLGLEYDSGMVNYMIHDQASFKSYNSIITKEYMAIIPRSHERHHGVSVNALSFLGSFLVDADSFGYHAMKKEGPLQFLTGVTRLRALPLLPPTPLSTSSGGEKKPHPHSA